MKVTKTKEYDLNLMDIDELKKFLNEHHNIRTDYYYSYHFEKSAIIDEDFNIQIVGDGSYLVPGHKAYKELRKWYKNKIKELENE